MAWAASLDRAIKTVRDTFPATATLAPRAGGSHALTLVFDEVFQIEGTDQDGLRVMTTEPRATVRLADLPVVPKVYDSLTIGTGTYRISRVAPDGSGMVALSLEVV